MATATKELLLGTLVLTYLPAIIIASIQAFTNFFESGMKMVLISLTVCAAVLNSRFSDKSGKMKSVDKYSSMFSRPMKTEVCMTLYSLQFTYLVPSNTSFSSMH